MRMIMALPQNGSQSAEQMQSIEPSINTQQVQQLKQSMPL